MITTEFVATGLGRIDRNCTFVMENFGQCGTPTGMYDMAGRSPCLIEAITGISACHICTLWLKTSFWYQFPTTS